jgi:hypothetical protein
MSVIFTGSGTNHYYDIMKNKYALQQDSKFWKALMMPTGWKEI